jgi:hypothetical protein
MIQNKTQNRNETSATISKFTYTATSLATRLSQEKTKATDRVLGCSDEEGLCVPSYTHSAPVTQESFLMQPTRMQHCNLQLVTGTVSSGQLCLGKKKKNFPSPPQHTILKPLSSIVSQSLLQEPNFVKTTHWNPTFLLLREVTFGVNLARLPRSTATWQQCPFHTFPSPPIGPQPDKGASHRE